MCIFNRRKINGPVIAYKVCYSYSENTFSPIYSSFLIQQIDTISINDIYKSDITLAMCTIKYEEWEINNSYIASNMSYKKNIVPYYGYHAFKTLEVAKWFINNNDRRHFRLIKVKLSGTVLEGDYPIINKYMLERRVTKLLQCVVGTEMKVLEKIELKE